jgi:2-polyprenyl-3-methyl-5-hydroxy-6-metoxy-1,4-benzoquinol methylase
MLMNIALRDKLVAQYRQIHNLKKYGASGPCRLRWLRPVLKEMKPRSVLDYGCGQSDLVNQLGAKQTFRYDPAIAGIDILPDVKVDLVTCTDVLEHVPEENLRDTLLEIKGCGASVYLAISCRKAREILPNGENAHCTVMPYVAWKTLLQGVFKNVVVLCAEDETRTAMFLCG